MRVEWSEPALADLVSIRDYIARDSPHYARLFIERLFESVEPLVDHPQIGRHVPEAVGQQDIRELIYQNYRLIYRVQSDRVLILTIIHARRDLGGAKAPPWETK